MLFPISKTRREELLVMIRDPYNEASSHFYESWSDSSLVRSSLRSVGQY